MTSTIILLKQWVEVWPCSLWTPKVTLQNCLCVKSSARMSPDTLSECSDMGWGCGWRWGCCYHRSYSLRQPLFAFISLSHAEWYNTMESRGGLGFFEYVSSFILEGYLSSDRVEGPPSSQPACLSTDTSVCWWLMQRNDEWLSNTAGYGQIFVPAGTGFEIC